VDYKESWFKFRSATLITAAFFGTDKVKVCSIEGTAAGFTLLWGIIFSIIAYIILNDLVSRTTAANQNSLEQNLMKRIGYRHGQLFVDILILVTVLLGNSVIT
jgi:Mn2+/Fe2+ NRAMP family transporter